MNYLGVLRLPPFLTGGLYSREGLWVFCMFFFSKSKNYLLKDYLGMLMLASLTCEKLNFRADLLANLLKKPLLKIFMKYYKWQSKISCIWVPKYFLKLLTHLFAKKPKINRFEVFADIFRAYLIHFRKQRSWLNLKLNFIWVPLPFSKRYKTLFLEEWQQ